MQNKVVAYQEIMNECEMMAAIFQGSDDGVPLTYQEFSKTVDLILMIPKRDVYEARKIEKELLLD